MIQAMGQWLIAEELPQERKAGKIITPENATVTQYVGKVLSIGDGVWLQSGVKKKIDIYEGDRVVWGQGAGMNMTIEDKDVVVLRDDAIVAVLK